jgi:hypothetical protein
MTTDHIHIIKTKYFDTLARQQALEADAVLLIPGQDNRRLFLVIEGMLTGYLEDSDGDRFEIFTAGPLNLVGVYSFFSPTHQSYSTVVATEPTLLAVIDEEQVQQPGFDYPVFAADMLPAVVNEIYIRQLLAYRIHHERQETVRRLIQVEKMASLGQMAAGLAHELNNAIGVIRRNAETLASRLRAQAAALGQGKWLPWFERGLSQGQALSSEEVRSRRQSLEDALGLSHRTAKKLAKAGIAPEDMAEAKGANREADAAALIEQFEAGAGLHDLILAAQHAENVVRSVRELGAQYRREPLPTDLNRTLREALALLRKNLKTIEVQLEAGDIPELVISPSDWLQVWINLIKNAAEALISAQTPKPRIRISTDLDGHAVRVRIVDNGPGIPPELAEHIFQPNVTTKRDGLDFGLGLGLTIVERIVQSYQGQMAVSSRPGETIFTLHLPIGPA